jgi:membrane fusion protein (multidrug efflux system)
MRAAEAEAASAEAQTTRTTRDAERMRELYNGGAASRQALDAAEAAEKSAKAALRAARERVASAAAGLEQARARRKTSEAGLAQARARLDSAGASARQAWIGVGAARTALAQARAKLGEAQAGEAGARTVPEQLSVTRGQASAAKARVKQAAAALRNAELQLSYTIIASPVDGVVTKKSVEPGQYVQPGQSLLAVVGRRAWVVANFKETQIRRMRPGQTATVEIDTYPGRRLRGRVDSIGAATGAKFSLLPAENATGNFVKVVQRVPVKIVLDKPVPNDITLRPGQNVTATVDLRSAGR